jgi:AraC family transcriptional regulator
MISTYLTPFFDPFSPFVVRGAYLCVSMPKKTDFPHLLVTEKSRFEELPLLFSKQKNIPGSWSLEINRRKVHPTMVVNDLGTLVYNFDEKEENRFLSLSFCVAGRSFCSESVVNCEECRLNPNAQCVEQTGTVDELSFRFEPLHLNNLIKTENKNSELNALLKFKYDHSFSRPVLINGRIRHTLDSILNHRYADTVENIFINAQTQILLLYTLESMNTMQEEEVPACKFLAYHEEREKIIKAREILLQHIGDPITIKELSRKVAINECYLKKGFKVMFGTTIFDFYQDQRMEHARYLLYEKGLTVSEVSAMLGYSSISHFSTAFKKHTGLKPCELLVK